MKGETIEQEIYKVCSKLYQSGHYLDKKDKLSPKIRAEFIKPFDALRKIIGIIKNMK